MTEIVVETEHTTTHELRVELTDDLRKFMDNKVFSAAGHQVTTKTVRQPHAYVYADSYVPELKDNRLWFIPRNTLDRHLTVSDDQRKMLLAVLVEADRQFNAGQPSSSPKRARFTM